MDIQTWILEKVGIDKLLHFSLGGWIGLIVNQFVGHWVIPILVSFVLGLFKDLVIDKLIRKTKCDYIDVLWTTLGGLISTLAVIL